MTGHQRSRGRTTQVVAFKTRRTLRSERLRGGSVIWSNHCQKNCGRPRFTEPPGWIVEGSREIRLTSFSGLALSYSLLEAHCGLPLNGFLNLLKRTHLDLPDPFPADTELAREIL